MRQSWSPQACDPMRPSLSSPVLSFVLARCEPPFPSSARFQPGERAGHFTCVAMLMMSPRSTMLASLSIWNCIQVHCRCAAAAPRHGCGPGAKELCKGGHQAPGEDGRGCPSPGEDLHLPTKFLALVYACTLRCELHPSVSADLYHRVEAQSSIGQDAVCLPMTS